MKFAPLPFVLIPVLGLVFAAADISWGQKTQGPAYSDVAPIFQARCSTCHSGPKAPKGLHLNTYENIMKGGQHAVVVPGEPEQSELFLRITGAKKPRMPRNGPPWLTEKETALVEEWIATGARP